MPDFGAPEELFRDTAWYYARFRPPYPGKAIEMVAERFDLADGSRVIDLGCGTGQLSIPLALRGCEVIAIDPSPDMLAQGREEAARSGASRIAWLQGDDASFGGLVTGSFDACVMGSSFHWMDRPAVMRTLEGLIAERGGVALLGNEVSGWTEEAAWAEVCREVIVEFLGPDRRAGAGIYTDPPERHETLLGRSAFSKVETHYNSTRRLLSVEDVVGLQLSSSYASPALLGDRMDAFCETLTDRLTAIATAGVFDWTLRTEVILATR